MSATSAEARWQEVGDGIFRRRHRSFDLNVGLVLGDDGALLVDTRANHREAEDLRAALAGVVSTPVRWVVNTHFHWDHTFGNSVFSDAVLIGHRRCRDVLVADGEREKRDLLESDWVPVDDRPYFEEVVIEPPRILVADRLAVDVGGRLVEIRHLGAGHTDSDVAVFVDEVCFAGDLVEEGSPPSFDDSFPAAWVETLDRLLPLLPPTVVPGHGDVVGPDFVRDQRRLISAAVEAVDVGPLSPMQELVPHPPYPGPVMEVVADRREVERRAVTPSFGGGAA